MVNGRPGVPGWGFRGMFWQVIDVSAKGPIGSLIIGLQKWAQFRPRMSEIDSPKKVVEL